MIALWSVIASFDSVTVIAGVPITAATCSGGSSSPPSSRSTRGRGIVVRVGVTVSALLIVLPQPATRRQRPAIAAFDSRMCVPQSA